MGEQDIADRPHESHRFGLFAAPGTDAGIGGEEDDVVQQIQMLCVSLDCDAFAGTIDDCQILNAQIFQTYSPPPVEP